MLRSSAEAKFRNFEGIQYGRRFNNAAGAARGVANTEILDPNDRTWTIAVANGATSSKTATIFGANYDLTDANLDSNITITVSESTHLQVKTELLSQPVRILGMKMTVSSSATQFSNVLSIYDQKSTGALEKRLFQPLNYRSAQNYLTTQIDVPSFELLLSASTYIQFTVNGSETVTFTFTIVEKTLVYNTLRNSSVVAVSNQPAPTGLPQIDMPRGV